MVIIDEILFNSLLFYLPINILDKYFTIFIAMFSPVFLSRANFTCPYEPNPTVILPF